MSPKIENFTISYALDIGMGRKSSNFVSVTFRLPEAMESDSVEFEEQRLDASKRVTIWAIQDAVMRGELSSEDAKERLEIVRLNFEGISKSLAKKRNN